MVDKYTVTTGTGLNFDSDATWSPINIRSDAFQWTASGSGTDEYYLEASGGGNPTGVLSGLVEPANVQAAGSALSSATAGSLTVSSWDWADNDTLGYSTIYVRLGSGLADPDAQVDGYVTFTDSPNANDNIFFRGAPGIDGGNFSSTELDDIKFLAGFSGTVGDALTPLVLDMGDANTLDVNATGTIYLSVGSAAVSPTINRTASASNGQAGLYLSDCSALNDLFARGGTTKLVNCSVDDAYVSAGATVLGDEDTGCTGDLHNNGGTITWNGTGVDIFNDGGNSTINGTDAWTTVSCSSGTLAYNSTGTITNAIAVSSGTIDLTNSSAGQTVSNVKVEATGKVVYDSAHTTIGSVPTGDGPKQIKGGTT